ncbi:hypothetical protein PG2006B_0006 [Bifidobacterium animalis subsp. animalis]|nr:hypothetical protein PG2006B_0006 [Bifidobacterium animalis subsp. animalis]
MCEHAYRFTESSVDYVIETSSMACFTETSVRSTTAMPICGTVFGSIRRFDRAKTHLRHISRKYPKNMPQNMLTAASFTEASEETTTQTPFHGTSHGNIRKICHFQTTPRHSSRKHPQNRPPKRPSTGRFSETSARSTTAMPICGTTYGNFRKTCHSQTNPRHGSRTHPQNRPPRHGLRKIHANS